MSVEEWGGGGKACFVFGVMDHLGMVGWVGGYVELGGGGQNGV